VEAGVGHPDGDPGAAGGGLPALGQADASVVPEQALVVPGGVGVDSGRGGGRRRLGPEPGGPERSRPGQGGRARRVRHRERPHPAAGHHDAPRALPARTGLAPLAGPSTVSFRPPPRATPRPRRSAARLVRTDAGALTTLVLTCLRSRTTRAPSETAWARRPA